MKKNNSSNIKPNWFILYLLIIIAASFAELYFIINMPDDYFVLCGVGMIDLVACYLIFDTLIYNIKENQEKELDFDERMKSQKALYLENKNGLEEVKVSIESLQKSLEESNDMMMKMNKAIAKTIIKKNIELVGDIKYTINNINENKHTD